jgi:hypothetical protein
MKAIITKYLGPTNHRGSRIRVSAEDCKTITVSWSSELDSEDNHYAAAYEYACKMGWIANSERPETIGVKLIGGSYRYGYFFVPLYSGNKRKYK